ncbi:MAG: hypothetical protein M1840_007700 [Geoglossum simile]|nr:MAG: hypothetical protein M1840_007700 [Geoglossum simile]
MSPINLLYGGLNFTHASSFSAGVQQFVTDRSAVGAWIGEHWEEFGAWLERPYVLAVVMAWWITFAVVMVITLSAGFGPSGIVAGSMAAGFQAWMYGAFTPAGGIFATLTSLGMLGLAAPAFVQGASAVATVVSVIVWACGAGR